MNDKIIQLLRRAKAIAENEPKTHQVSLVITKIDEAILWGEFGDQIGTTLRISRGPG